MYKRQELLGDGPFAAAPVDGRGAGVDHALHPGLGGGGEHVGQQSLVLGAAQVHHEADAVEVLGGRRPGRVAGVVAAVPRGVLPGVVAAVGQQAGQLPGEGRVAAGDGHPRERGRAGRANGRVGPGAAAGGEGGQREVAHRRGRREQFGGGELLAQAARSEGLHDGGGDPRVRLRQIGGDSAERERRQPHRPAGTVRKAGRGVRARGREGGQAGVQQTGAGELPLGLQVFPLGAPEDGAAGLAVLVEGHHRESRARPVGVRRTGLAGEQGRLAEAVVGVAGQAGQVVVLHRAGGAEAHRHADRVQVALHHHVVGPAAAVLPLEGLVAAGGLGGQHQRLAGHVLLEGVRPGCAGERGEPGDGAVAGLPARVEGDRLAGGRRGGALGVLVEALGEHHVVLQHQVVGGVGRHAGPGERRHPEGGRAAVRLGVHDHPDPAPGVGLGEPPGLLRAPGVTHHRAAQPHPGRVVTGIVTDIRPDICTGNHRSTSLWGWGFGGVGPAIRRRSRRRRRRRRRCAPCARCRSGRGPIPARAPAGSSPRGGS